MFPPKGKKYVKYKEKPILSLMMRLIMNNKMNAVHKILELNESYFYPERKADFIDINGFNRFFNNVVNFKEETCYTTAAINKKNGDMLQLLIDYGFACQIIKEIEYEPISEEENTEVDTYIRSNHIWIDPEHPFTTEDDKIFEILLQTVTNLNQTYEICWKDRNDLWQYNEMSLLSMALYFNKMGLAEVLVRKGARLEFNLYSDLLDYTKGFLLSKGTFLHSAIINGYLDRKIESYDTLLQLYEWSPIAIILRKCDWQQIDWLINHTEDNPIGIREIAKTMYCLRNSNFRQFIKKYPKFINYLEWKDICKNSNEAALQMYLQERKPKLSQRDIMDLLDFDFQTARSLNEIYQYVLSREFLRCVKLVHSYAPELFQIEEVQKQLYNTALFIECINNEMKKYFYNSSYGFILKHEYRKGNVKAENLIQSKQESSLLSFYDEIAANLPDATLFIRWYYTKGRALDLYSKKARDAVKVIRMCHRAQQKEKPRLHLAQIFQDDVTVSQMELAALIDHFQLLSEEGKLSNLYKMIIQKDSIPLLKRLLAASILKNNELKLITEYAIEIGAEKLIPMLLLYKMKKSC
ncbi:MAG: hypothetical protein GX306_11765 [Clostridiales bacterium]|nr:hypothetical protein [Clostridiales bacterium]